MRMAYVKFVRVGRRRSFTFFCPAMNGLWQRLIPRRKRNSFFTLSLIEWVYENLGDSRTEWECPWSTVFAMAVWWG